MAMLSADASRHARSAFGWVESVAVAVEGGCTWREAGQVVHDLYAGTAGELMGCPEGMASGVAPARIAEGAVARLTHLASRNRPVESLPDDGLFTGWAGVAVALRAW